MEITNSNSTSLVKFELKSVSGIKHIGFYELSFNFKAFTRETKDIVEFHDFAIDINVNGSNSGSFLGTSTVKNRSVIQTYTYSADTYLNLHLRVNSDQIYEIEEIRNGRGLEFFFSGYVSSSLKNTSGLLKDIYIKNSSFKVSQNDWLEVLQTLNYKHYLLFEIPLPKHAGHRSLNKAMEHLISAREDFLQGEYRQTISKCREVLEAINKGLKLDGVAGNAVGRFRTKESRELMNKDERELVIREVVRHYSHLAHHPNTDIEFTEFTRHDASLILGITSAILSKADL